MNAGEGKLSCQEGRHRVSVNPCTVSSGQRSESGIGRGLMPSCDGFIAIHQARVSRSMNKLEPSLVHELRQVVTELQERHAARGCQIEKPSGDDGA